MADYWNECYTGVFTEEAPEHFKQNVCKFCRNLECVNAGARSNLWTGRMSTQVDRLLDNPVFANPRDPKYTAVTRVVFQDLVKEAVNLEITSKKGDWEIPTATETAQYAQKLTTGTTEDSSSATPPSRLVDEVQVKPLPQSLSKAKTPTAAVATSPIIPLPRVPEAVVGPERANFVPRAVNTAMPSEGIMLGGSAPSIPAPAFDPWAIPEKKDKVVPVGSKIVLSDEEPPKE